MSDIKTLRYTYKGVHECEFSCASTNAEVEGVLWTVMCRLGLKGRFMILHNCKPVNVADSMMADYEYLEAIPVSEDSEFTIEV